MLPVVEPDGKYTARRIIAGAVLLLPVALLPRLLGMAGSVYLATALAATVVMILFGVLFYCQRTILRAMRMLLATVIYLPILLVVLIADRYPR